MNLHLQEIQGMILNSTEGVLGRIIMYWPNILGALVVFLIGWGIAVVAYKIIVKSAMKIKLDFVLQKIGFERFLKKIQVKKKSYEILALIIKGYIIFMFTIGATKILHLEKVSGFLESVINYIPNLIVALFIILIGEKMAETVSAIVRSTMTLARSHAADMLSAFAKYLIIAFAVMAALVELDIASDLIEILFIGFIAMLALSGGLAFGLGGKETVKELIEDIRKHKKAKKTKKK